MLPMERKTVVLLVVFAAMLLITGCHAKPQKYMQDKTDNTPPAGMANPASVFCVNNSGTWSVKQDSEGNQQGICSFSDASWCDEWDYFRGHCTPGTNYTACAGQFWGKTVCEPDFAAVCARIEIGTAAPYEVKWQTFSNACKACISSTKMEVVVGYLHGECAKD
jgi:putative hemolysin